MNKFSFYFESSSANMPDTMDFPLLGVVLSSLGETFLFDPPDLRFSVVNVCNITALSFVCLLSLCTHLSLKLSLSHLHLLCRSLSLSFKAVFSFLPSPHRRWTGVLLPLLFSSSESFFTTGRRWLRSFTWDKTVWSVYYFESVSSLIQNIWSLHGCGDQSSYLCNHVVDTVSSCQGRLCHGLVFCHLEFRATIYNLYSTLFF